MVYFGEVLPPSLIKEGEETMLLLCVTSLINLGWGELACESLNLWILKIRMAFLSFIDQQAVQINEKETSYETLCAIWYHLYNLRNAKGTNGGLTLSLKLQAERY